MSRTYKRSKKSYLKQTQKNGSRYWTNDSLTVWETDALSDVDQEKYLVRNLVFRNGVRRKLVHEKVGYRYSWLNGEFEDKVYENDVFDFLLSGRGYSVPKKFRSELNIRFRAVSKNEIFKWMKNPEKNDAYMPKPGKFMNASWIYF